MKNRRPQKRKLVFCVVMLAAFLFPTYMGVLMVTTAAKKFENLDHIKGPITNLRFIKHERKRKYRTYYEDVLVLSIDGTRDEFGFTGNKYKVPLGMRKKGRTAEVYYDKEAKRIEGNVTLHVFDMTIDSYKVEDIEKVKKRERLGAGICFFLSTVVLILTMLGVKRIDEGRF